MKHFYYVITVEQNGKYFSYPIKATENDNLKSYFNKIDNAIITPHSNSETSGRISGKI